MDKNAILQADFLDILFDNRNKTYGAYVLRKEYAKNLYYSIGGAGAVAVLLLVGINLFPNHPAKTNLIPDLEVMVYTLPKEAPPLQPKPKEPVAKPKAASKPVATTTKMQAHSNRVEYVDYSVKPVNNDGNLQIGDKEIKRPDLVVSTISHSDPPPDDGETAYQPNIPSEPVFVADVMPSFPGGKEALLKFLSNNLRSPEDLMEGEQRTVKVRFVVGVDGKLKSFEVLQSGETAFDNEVIRVLKKMPNWKPGKAHNQDVSVYYTLPVSFVSMNE